MKQQVKGRTFGRVTRQRTALVRSLARALILNEHIETTEAKAKSLRPFVEKLVTKAKNDTLASRRVVLSRLGNDTEATKKLFAEIAPRYQERHGGYTRIVKSPKVLEDGRSVALISFV